MGYYDLNDAIEDSVIAHMSQGDIDSYYLYKGFIEQAIEQSEDAEDLKLLPDMKFDDSFEGNFVRTSHLIAIPVHRVMLIQSHAVRTKRTEEMKEFKIVTVLAHVMTDVPERLIHVNHLNKELMHFVLKSAWPLATIDIMHHVPAIMPHYEAMSDAYYDNDWEAMGKECAKIAHILHED